MKKRVFLLGLLALGLFSCSEKEIADPTTNGTDNEVSGDMERNFLSVSIVPANASATRADDEFKDGSKTENEVNSIRFYFFDKDGKSVGVKANGTSYYDVQKDEINQNWNSENKGPVESVVSAVIVLESPKDKGGKPAYMAAVINYEDYDLGEVNEISDLQAELNVKDYSSYTHGFIMSSSVYKGSKKTFEYEAGQNGKPGDDLIKGTPIDDQEIVAVPVYENIQATREKALEKKATIYVERVLAKVSVDVSTEMKGDKGETITLTDGTKLYAVGHVGSQADATSEDKIYVKFLGWNVTADRKKSRLVKKINTEWKMLEETIGETSTKKWPISWNNADNFRSYWAINPETEGDKIEGNYNFTTFDVGNKAFSHELGDTDCAYLQENAGKYEDGDKEDVINSKIIVGAQLVDEKGNALELVEWQGDIYLFDDKPAENDEDVAEDDEDSVEGVNDPDADDTVEGEKKKPTHRDEVLNKLAADTDLYIQNSDKTWRKLTGTDVKLEFRQATDADAAYEINKQKTNNRRYYVYLKLKDETAKYGKYRFDEEKGWWIDTKENSTGYNYNDKLIVEALESVGYIKYWNTGYTYYWVDIRHLGNIHEVKDDDGGTTAIIKTTGSYGVVRNHWYDYTFTSVKGLGVPVAEPDLTIWPEEPGDPEYFFLAAEVKILSWRMVYGDNTELGW